MKRSDFLRPVWLLALLAVASLVQAQPGGWNINPKNYQFTMSMVARIETDSMPNNALNNHVAAFFGNQIRGYAKPVQAGGGQVLYFMNLYSNSYLGDKFYFLAYIGDVAKIFESQDTVEFLHHKLAGSIQQPIVLYFSLSPRPLIYSLADIRYEESTCTPGFLVNIEASDNEDSEGNGLKYKIVGGADSSRFQVDSLSGELRWKNFTPDFENPMDADGDNVYLVDVQVRDLDGFFSVQNIAVTVADDPPPSATCPAAITANTSDDGTGNCSTSVPGPISVGTPPGNCATYQIGYLLEGTTTGQGMGQLPANQPFNSGKTTVQYTVSDESGALSKTCSFTVTVRDNEPPTVTCPNPVAVGTDFGGCSAVPSGTAVTVLDNCTNPVISYVMSGATPGTGTGQVPTNQVFAAGVTTVAYTVQETGDATKYTCSFTVTVTDNQNPSLSCPANKSATLSSGCNTTQTGTAATTSDNCSGSLLTYALSGATTGSGSGQMPGGQKFEAGVTTVLYTATDGDGTGTNTCSFTITVVETLKPAVTCPSSTNVTVGANCETELADYRLKANISDNCTPDSALLIVQEPAPGTILNGLGTTLVKITATDLSGNSRYCTLNVTVKDTPQFEIACPGNQQVCDGVIGDYRSLGQLTAGCSGVLPPIVQDPMPGSTIPAYNDAATVTLSANNGVKNTSCTFSVAWRDTIAPEARCKPATTVVQANGEATIAVSDVENGSTDNCGVQGGMLSKTLFTCTDVGVNTVTLTVTDVNGVSGTCTATVTVNDPNAVCCALPQAICQTNPTVYLNENGQVTIAVADVDNGSTYDCGLKSMDVGPTSATCSNVGTPITVTLTVTDINDNASSCTASVAVADTVSPTALCRNTTVYLDNTGNGSTTTAAVDNGSSDNCSIGSLELSRTSFTCTDVGPNTVTLTVTDVHTNTATCMATVTVADTTDPTALCQNITVYLDNAGNGSTTAAAVDNGSSDNCGINSLGLSQTTFTCSHVGPNTVTLTATDANTNTATCMATVTVADTVAPAAQCQNITVYLDNAGNGSTTAAAVDNGSSDNCGIGSLELSRTNFTCTDVGTNTVTLMVTDLYYNVGTCTATVTVLDTIKPTVVCIANQTKSTDPGVCTYTVPGAAFQPVSYGDNCGQTTLQNNINQTPSLAGAVFQKGNTTVVWTVRDGSNNTATCQFSVTVLDTEPPMITCPGALTVSCAGEVPAPNPALVTATDNCGAVTKTHLLTTLPYNVACINRFSVTRYYRATDGSGNSASCSQIITVFDNTAPVFTFVPANTTVQCNSVPAVGTPVATDNCGGIVAVTYNGQTRVDGTCPDAYTLTRKWTATDACGNTKTATQRISVIDTQKPNFTSTPANITVQCDAIPAPANPAATDNCDNSVSITYNGQTKTNGACPNAYTLTRRWTAADNCNNTRSISQRITVVDNIKPVFTSFPANTTIACSEPLPPVATPTASDACGGAVTITYLGQSSTSGTCPGNYQIKRTWRATDVCGNSTAATQTIQVTDENGPVFTSVPPPLTIQCTDPLPPLVNPTATDACGGYVHITFLGNVPSGSGCAADYTVTRTWRADDLCGNTATTSQVITVLGNGSYEEEGAENRDQAAQLKTQNSKLITVNPNPTTDRIQLDLTDFAGESVTVSIHGDLGQLIWERRIPAVEELKLSISLREAGATPGIYTLSVRSASRVAARRVVLVE
ncbi:MAG: HYR domain-containing protein [Saprospiraceae bacterium]|jgi:hypothetical protein|nr:HYR domain-containing protein [Saprospiraceae bacterium]